MEREIKYTTDGKKVVVIGKLNSQELIVQEVFISGDIEIPSGENFVVKTLHDAPALSWKETELKNLNERFDKEQKQWLTELDKLDKSYREKTKELKLKLNYVGLALKNADEKSFETLVNYITGEIKFIVVESYDVELLPINDFNELYENKLRLISLYGKDDGTFGYAVGEYYDYSGGNKKFHPFSNYEDALEKLKEIVISQDVSDERIKVSKKYGFELDKEKLKQYKSKRIESLNTNIENYQKNIDEWSKSIEELNK